MKDDLSSHSGPSTQHSDLGEAAKGQFLVYQAEDGQLKLDVRFEDESFWLTQPLMAELFQTTQQNVSQHILNIYEEKELVLEATHKKFLSVRLEGKREVKRLLDYYNLDMIISVGYRVKSHVATRFRIWATQQFKRAEPQGGFSFGILMSGRAMDNRFKIWTLSTFLASPSWGLAFPFLGGCV
ncbi:RhuM family protein [Coraliomargarita algicola]|uniref:RhuM family protein n=1 Tax=Coraliomargarita algicola TaxID=3092156 RepID=A0ABZ0RNG6_9BACT|nr:RhuM family protein [Coraliomargarita sp. J2-16]WPJ97769.1 RhuM family protein [Coraliomargarita sp. J2-16]